MKTEKLLKLATEKVFVVNRFKRSQDKLRQQCFRLVRSGRLTLVEKTHEQVMFRESSVVNKDSADIV